MQDEMLNAWKVKHGRKVQHGVLGRVKERLMRHPDRVAVMSRFVPTTQFCYECGYMHKDITVRGRTYVCPACGAVHDRDVHSAECMVWLYDNMREYIGLGGSKFTRADFDEEVSRIFGGWDNQRAKPEDATSLA